MNFKGTYKPPAVPITNSPIKIAGPGRFSIGRNGIEVAGYQADRRTRIEAALIVAVLSVIAGVLVLTAEAVFSAVPPIVMQMAGGALGGLLYFAVVAGRAKHLADKPIEMTIPWPCVARASRDLRHPGGIVIEVKGGDTRGTLHFHPTDGVDDCLSALRARNL
jgi:hypothetical protein